MARWTELLVLAAVAGVASSCAFDDGDPWARASFELSLGFEPGDGRLDDEGRLLTPGDWAIALETPTARVDSITLTMAGAGGALSFDPAEPPPGYSLCHNGHCHADDGRLVDYEDIALELATASGAGAATVAAAYDVEVPLATPIVVPGGTCADGCDVPRGEFASVAVSLSGVSLRGVAYDRRTGDRARVGDEGVPFEVTLAGPVRVATPVDGAADRGESVDVLFATSVMLPPSLFDDVDWSAWAGASTTVLLDETEAAAMIAAAISNDASTSVDVLR